jgi:transposase, IS6 family
VGWYLRFSLSYRDVEELLAERGLHADHVTVWRWVQRYGQEIQRRLRPRLRPTNDSWRVDETFIRVKGKWVYLYRAVDSSGATIDFLLSAKRDAAAAERFLAKALAVRTIRTLGSSTPTSMSLTRRPSLSSKPTVF